MCNAAAKTQIGAFLLVALASAPLTFAAAHEAHKTTCNDTALNAMSADAQAMPDAEAKTKAMKELAMAKEMMSRKDMSACEEHMHKAMEVIEE